MLSCFGGKGRTGVSLTSFGGKRGLYQLLRIWPRSSVDRLSQAIIEASSSTQRVWLGLYWGRVRRHNFCDGYHCLIYSLK